MGFIGYVKVLRPPLLILGATASLGLLNWSGQLETNMVKAFLILLMVFFGNEGWTIYNELHDKEVDKVNKPWKPLPSGQVDETTVFSLVVACLGASILANCLLLLFYSNFYAVFAIFHACAYIYNAKRRDVLGNACLGTCYGLMALVCVYPRHLLFPLAFGLFTIAHNINQQFQDVEAERTRGVVTLPQQLGTWTTFYLTETLTALSLATFGKLFLETGYLPISAFIVTTAIVAFSTLFMLGEGGTAHKAVENLVRRGGRLLLLIGFIWMVFY